MKAEGPPIKTNWDIVRIFSLYHIPLRRTSVILKIEHSILFGHGNDLLSCLWEKTMLTKVISHKNSHF